MTEQEAQALALLVGGLVVDDRVYVPNRVYVPKPAIDPKARCTGCSCADKANAHICQDLPCSGVIWIEVPHD